MAIMGRKKQMVKQMIDSRRAETREMSEEQRQKAKELQKPVDDEEHQKRIELLKNLGLLKDK